MDWGAIRPHIISTICRFSIVFYLLTCEGIYALRRVVDVRQCNLFFYSLYQTYPPHNVSRDDTIRMYVCMYQLHLYTLHDLDFLQSTN